jgi:hypothetical protein
MTEQPPTRYTELNEVLDRLARGAQSCLGDDLVALYLQGSFAFGDADEHSDVDFLALVRGEVADERERALQAMHKELHAHESFWAQHLEGSYAQVDRFRRIQPEAEPFLFLDNGASQLVLDTHCNSAVVRWILLRHGIVLYGPPPTVMIDPVPAEVLRAEARDKLREYVAWASEPTRAGPMSRWKQPYLVLTFCRILSTLDSGEVGTKREAAEWARTTLDPRWAPLIERAVADRADPWERVRQAAEPDLVAETLAFARYAAERGERP